MRLAGALVPEGFVISLEVVVGLRGIAGVVASFPKVGDVRGQI